MSRIHAEPRGLEAPLAGGSASASVSVEPLIAGHVEWPSSMMETPGGRMLTLRLAGAMMTNKDPWKVPVPAFLLRHPSAGAILVDTGLHPSVASDPAQNFGRLATRFANVSLDPGTDVPAQLRDRGLDPSDVKVVVMTHLHVDHASAISEFGGASIVVSKPEWDAASGDRLPLLNGYRRAQFDFAFEYRTVDFDRREIDSYASFGRTFDLLGDGSIRLAFLPGHSAGHMGVVCRLRDRDFVIGGDAIYTYRQLDDAPPPPRPVDPHNWRRSRQELKLYRTQFPNAIITPGHDPSFYEQLEERYE